MGEDVAEIRHFVESAEIAGGCMPPQFEHYLFSDTVEERRSDAGVAYDQHINVVAMLEILLN